MSRALLALVAILLCCRPAAAQEVKPVDREASAAIAAKLIADVNGEAFFSGGSWDYGPVVRHDPSGMVCRLFSDPKDTLRVYEHPDMPRGADVSCGIWINGAYFTLYATPAAAFGGFDRAATDSDKSLTGSGQFSKIEEYRGATAKPPPKGMPKMVVRRYTAEFEGARVFTRLALIDMGDWVIKQRVTAPVESASDADDVAQLVLNTIASDMGAKLED